VGSQIRILFNHNRSEVLASVSLALRQAGFEVKAAGKGLHALDVLTDQTADLAILDVITSILNGLKDCDKTDLPTLLVSRTDEAHSAFPGFQNGVSGSNFKFIRLSDLVDCVGSFLKNSTHEPSSQKQVYQYDDLTLDLSLRQVSKQGQFIQVTPTGFRMLVYFMQHPGKVVRKADLLRGVWGFVNISGDTNLVETAIKRLRKEIEDNPKQPRYIHTVWGSGYRFGESRKEDPESGSSSGNNETQKST
jgi:DNA-binding response OmpR family regulator